ncbi:MAG: hypothetical protein EON58_22935 [Alphaproteobacteria bacterium]|nr:MAG: hypothetical protein EON58_22935 [Alphaproteobacteria bacterium]
MAWVRDVGSFYNFIGYVVLRAPNAFPREDYLQDHEQMTLDKAFEELRAGLRMAQADFPDRLLVERLDPVLSDCLQLYRSGNNIAAALRLQSDFQDAIFRAD